jgi:hypothetical protein
MLWALASVLDWGNETFRIVEDGVYEGLSGGGERLGSACEATNLSTIECQLKKTGVRLGMLLNAVMGMGGDGRTMYQASRPSHHFSLNTVMPLKCLNIDR